MPNLKVDWDKDRVIVDFGKSIQDVILTPAMAETLWQEMVRCADKSEEWVKAGGSLALFKNEPYCIKDIRSWDGNVNIRFDRFVGPIVTMPIKAARVIANRIMLKVEEAKYRFSLNINPVVKIGAKPC
jgi:hypothetical protein